MILFETLILGVRFVLLRMNFWRHLENVLLQTLQLLDLRLLSFHHLPHEHLLHLTFVLLILRRLVHRFLFYFFNLSKLQRIFSSEWLFYIIVLRSHIGRSLIVLILNFSEWDTAKNELGSEKSVWVILVDGLCFTPAELLDFIVLPH